MKKGKTNTDITEMSFDEIVTLDEKDLNKKISIEKKRTGKMIQLTSQINALNLRIMNGENKFKESLTRPDIDSIELMMQIRCDREELNAATELFGQLFPKNKNQLMLLGGK